MISQDAASRLLASVEGFLKAAPPVDPTCWSCGRETPAEHADGCLWLFATEAVTLAKQPPNMLAQQLQVASKTFAEMAADADMSREHFVERYGPILLPMFRGVADMLGLQSQFAAAVTPTKPS